MRNLLIFLCLFIFFCSSCGLGWYSEHYCIKTSKKNFVTKVDSFKMVHPEYSWHRYDEQGNVQDSDHAYDPFDNEDANSTFLPGSGYEFVHAFEKLSKSLSKEQHTTVQYSITFYIPSDNEVLRCSIRGFDTLDKSDQFQLSFDFVADTSYFHTRQIRKDLSKSDKLKYMALFENQILNRLNVEWEK